MPTAVESLRRGVFGHTYTEGAIRLFLELVLDAACSLRGASAVMKLLGGLLPDLERAPVASTGQMWLLRIGLFELMRPKEVAEDWVWIVDHTVQIGTTKCLVITACRLSDWQTLDRALTHHDLQVLALEPVQKSDGATVYRQLQETCQKTGIVPRSILSDEGTDLKGGIQAFCGDHPRATHSLDIAHQAAKLLKRELEADDRWAEFLRQTGGAKQRLAQTPLAHLLPPTPRNKARYMNLDELIAWGNNALRYLENPRPIAGQPVDLDQLHAKLGWLANYRLALHEWGQWMGTISTTLDYVRRQGYHRGAASALQQLLGSYATPESSARLGARLIEFVASQSAPARDDEHLIGSSECLESLIGKGKRLEGQQSASGFTRMILGMAAAVAMPTKDYLMRALAHIKTHDVSSWCERHLGISVQSQRRQAFAIAGTKHRQTIHSNHLQF